MPVSLQSDYWVGSRRGDDYIGRPARTMHEAMRIAAQYHINGYTAIRIRDHANFRDWPYRQGDEKLPARFLASRNHRWKKDTLHSTARPGED